LVDPLEVGRGGSGLLLDDPAVSRRHLELRVEDARIVVTDLGSANGTTIDGAPVAEATSLEPGSTLRLGDTTIEHVTGVPALRLSPPPPIEGETSIERVAVAAARDGPRGTSVDFGEGTVTIVFSDIESSTELAHRLGDEKWFQVLGIHNEIVRRHVDRAGGVEVKSQGDGFMLAFASARRALGCAIEVQREVCAMGPRDSDWALRVRLGAHTGEVIVGDNGDLLGHHVNVAARIADQAVGGEILVSSLVKEIAEARGDLSFGEPRSVTLRGLDGVWRLHPVLWEIDGLGETT
jgi:class 3 adenylate cyclase